MTDTLQRCAALCGFYGTVMATVAHLILWPQSGRTGIWMLCVGLPILVSVGVIGAFLSSTREAFSPLYVGNSSQSGRALRLVELAGDRLWVMLVLMFALLPIMPPDLCEAIVARMSGDGPRQRLISVFAWLGAFLLKIGCTIWVIRWSARLSRRRCSKN